MSIPIPGTIPGAPGPAHADSGCTTTNGVTVIVDFGVLGGGIQRGCAMNPASGMDALHRAGFTTAGVPRFGNAFVCRIDNKPTPAQESCTNTPPGTFSWTYWKAAPGATAWKFSNFGVLGGSAPAPGAIEGWAFTNHAPPPDPPGISPADAIPPPVTVPPPTQPPVTNPAATVKPGGGGNAVPPATPQPGTDNGGGSKGATPGATAANGGTVAPPITLADGTPAPTATTTAEKKTKAKAETKAKTKAKTKANTKGAITAAGDPERGDAIVERSALGAPAGSSSGGGSPLAAVLTVVLIAALAGGSFVLIRKRRLQSS